MDKYIPQPCFKQFPMFSALKLDFFYKSLKMNWLQIDLRSYIGKESDFSWRGQWIETPDVARIFVPENIALPYFKLGIVY